MEPSVGGDVSKHSGGPGSGELIVDDVGRRDHDGIGFRLTGHDASLGLDRFGPGEPARPEWLNNNPSNYTWGMQAGLGRNRSQSTSGIRNPAHAASTAGHPDGQLNNNRMELGGLGQAGSRSLGRSVRGGATAASESSARTLTTQISNHQTGVLECEGSLLSAVVPATVRRAASTSGSLGSSGPIGDGGAKSRPKKTNGTIASLVASANRTTAAPLGPVAARNPSGGSGQLGSGPGPVATATRVGGSTLEGSRAGVESSHHNHDGHRSTAEAGLSLTTQTQHAVGLAHGVPAMVRPPVVRMDSVGAGSMNELPEYEDSPAYTPGVPMTSRRPRTAPARSNSAFATDADSLVLPNGSSHLRSEPDRMVNLRQPHISSSPPSTSQLHHHRRQSSTAAGGGIVKIGDKYTLPLVHVEDVEAHLRILGAFHHLRTQVRTQVSHSATPRNTSD